MDMKLAQLAICDLGEERGDLEEGYPKALGLTQAQFDEALMALRAAIQSYPNGLHVGCAVAPTSGPDRDHLAEEAMKILLAHERRETSDLGIGREIMCRVAFAAYALADGMVVVSKRPMVTADDLGMDR